VSAESARVTADELVAAVGAPIAQFWLSLGLPDHCPEPILSGFSTGHQRSAGSRTEPSSRPSADALIDTLDRLCGLRFWAAAAGIRASYGQTHGARNPGRTRMSAAAFSMRVGPTATPSTGHPRKE
jgi:hypothetical protein